MQLIALDLETTGFYPLSDRIIEIGAVKFNDSGEVLATFDSLVRSDKPCSSGAFAAHGITPEEIAAAPPPDEVVPAFRDFLGSSDTLLLAHNARFDLGFLRATFGAMGLPAIAHPVACTLIKSRRVWPMLESHSLPWLAERFGLGSEGLHRALADADRVRLLWMLLKKG